ncbi:MAG: NAD-glutamate dehydrogenase domain-containing protein [Leptonema sp. (in: bacteria)]
MNQSEEQFVEFKKIFLKGFPKESINFLNKEDLEGFCRERWKFLNTKNRTIHIRCYNSETVWPFHTSILEIHLLDKPFIVDTVIDFIKSQGIRIFLLNNLILNVERDKTNRIISLKKSILSSAKNESYIYIEIERLDKKKLGEIQKKIQNNLKELEVIVHDFEKIKKNIQNISFESEDLKKEKDWICENFILMGYFFESKKNQEKEVLGILKNSTYLEISKKEFMSFFEHISTHKEEILYIESKIKSNVKPYKPLHLVVFYNTNSFYVIIGSFSGRGELTPRYLIPYLKRVLDKIAFSINAPLNGFRYKEIFKISQLIPLGILFSRPKELLREWISFFVNNLYVSEQKIQITIDERYNGVWILVIELQKFADNTKYKEKLKENSINIETFFKRNYNQFEYSFLLVKSEKYSLKVLKEFLEKNTKEIFYSWHNKFFELLTFKISNNKDLKAKSEFYFKIIPNSFTDYLSPQEGLKNLLILETITKEKKFYVKFGKSISPLSKKEIITLNVYSCYFFSLTDIFPVLESIGFIILTEISFNFPFENCIKYLNIFYIQNSLEELDQDFLKKLENGIEDTLNQKYTIEKTNQLLLKTSLNIREINFIKALLAYYYQLYKQYSRIYLQEFIVKNSKFAELILEYLKIQFLKISDPTETEKKNLYNQIENFIYQVKTISEQTIAIHLKELLENIVRTNFFLNFEEIAIKFFAKKLSFIPYPRPLFEIFVYSKNLEGIHIRSDLISRGGIRWSDRYDDFRIEIYQLMKTQMIKNTSIIPNGAKGGFIIKKNLSNKTKQEIFYESQSAYQRFIYNLLSITDNIDSKLQVVHPTNMKVLDKKDPYLVVAADKGTATFSDLANQISNEKQFWLKDAFASGGSFGYDHKKQGITAKGAWESAKRHFLELGIDPNVEEITVIGIGDMSGDVFGNGMILSKKIKLIAAFNHLHIFIDPNPDPEISFNERLRLFRETKEWAEYDKNKIPKGGGIFERNNPKIELSQEIRELLKIPKPSVNGEELIQYILKAKADLLWNGGIGTYIKASFESNKEIQDPNNDYVRINANELNVKVIVEGGNLGMTYNARVEAAKKGIRLNTDFIDNAGGVNMSDREVNLKILLKPLLDKNKISFTKRNRIIKNLEKEMISKVLEDNEFNNLSIALENIRLKTYKFLLPNWINFLKSENIITKEELNIQEEITNPEICYLMSYTKLYFKNYFYSLEFDFPKSIENHFLEEYFPKGLRKLYSQEIQNHLLKKQIVKVNLLNLIINSQGSLHLFLYHKLTNKSFYELLEEYGNFIILSNLNLFPIYKKFSLLPRGFLYEALLNISDHISLIHILLNKNNKNLLDPKCQKNFNQIFYKFTKINNSKEKELQAPTSNKEFKKIDRFALSLEKTLLYYFLSIPLEPLEFLYFFKESGLEKVYNIIKNLNANHFLELKFQFRILNLFFNSINHNLKHNPKIIYDKVSPYLKSEKDLQLIDLFELVVSL